MPVFEFSLSQIRWKWACLLLKVVWSLVSLPLTVVALILHSLSSGPSETCWGLKWGHCVALEKTFRVRIFDIYHINEVIVQTLRINKLFSEENKSPRPQHCLKPVRWQGPPNINKVKQYEIIFGVKKISLFAYKPETRNKLWSDMKISAACGVFSHFSAIHRSHDCGLHLRRMIWLRLTLISPLLSPGQQRRCY